MMSSVISVGWSAGFIFHMYKYHIMAFISVQKEAILHSGFHNKYI